MSKEKFLHVSARPKKGFRRAGHMFLASAVTVLAVSELSEEEYEAIKNEPNLVVVESDGETPSIPPADTSGLKEENAELKKKLADLAKEKAASDDELEKATKAKDEAEAKAKEAADQVKATTEELSQAKDELKEALKAAKDAKDGKKSGK